MLSLKAKMMKDKPLTILLIDDDAGFASLVKHLLGQQNNYSFDVVWESETDKILETLKSDKQFDLILIDYFLPGNNGLEIAQKILDSNYQIPIVLLTTNRDIQIAIDAMKYGVVDYLLKEDVSETTFPRTIVNIYEKNLMRKQTEAAEKEKILSQKRAEAIKELIVTICHEFNNPLAAIKISTSILERQFALNEDKLLLEQLNQQITLMQNRIDKLKDSNINQVL